MKNFRNQQGVALLFALGMLTILLVTGMAFVANALTAQKVAANNSARTQSRMFAQSAVSRVLTAIMLYQHRIFNRGGDSAFPERFDSVYSSSGATGDTDGLTGANSLMNLPTDSTVVAENVAKDFNERFNSGWQGNWVYFYDNQNPSDRQIIGRAAWQVLSISPQILAPVFLSGHLQTDGSPNWTPNANRWGREIDEVYLVNSPAFRAAPGYAGNAAGVTASTMIKDFTANLFPVLQNGWSGVTNYSDPEPVKRWIEKWLMPDVRGGNVLDPVPVIPEVYSAVVGSRKRQFIRFNISEILQDNLAEYGSGITTASDPWYARFGINSTASAVAGNDSAALNALTANSPEAAIGDSYDFKLAVTDRPSLPFLRRIGNSAQDNPTFVKSDGSVNVEAWRKQIAANFNDYCDADSVPTSDAAPATWSSHGSTMPTYTGNEKTPYLYEMGFGLGLVSAEDKSIAKAGFAASSSNYVSSSKELTTSFNGYLNLKLYAKLANIYPLFNNDTMDKYYADCKPSSVQLWFTPAEVELKVTCDYTNAAGDTATDEKDITVEVSDTALAEFNKVFIASHNFAYSGTDETGNSYDVIFPNVDNSTGGRPYPVSTLDNPWGRIRMASFAGDTGVSYPVKTTLDYNTLKTLNGNNELVTGTSPVVTDIKVTVKKIKVVKVQIETERAVLGYKNGTNVTNVDFVRGFDSSNPLVWNDTKDTANAKELDFSVLTGEGSKNPALLLGGVRNFDPRQNLYPGDWERTMTIGTTAALQPTLEEIANVMDINSSGVGEPNGTVDSRTADFSPNKSSDTNRDVEIVEAASGAGTPGGPGWRDAANGNDDTKRLSTAFIRNAPMMSPWEIGLIHRGVKWQTLNIKRACDPDNNSVPITLAGHAPSANWEAVGTSFVGGDGAILDQIKMTDQCSTYGKINVNKLRSNDPEYNATYDGEMIRALFDQLLYDQQMNDFYTNSTRDSSQNFPATADVGTALDISAALTSVITNMTASRNKHTSRAQFLDWQQGANSSLGTAFGAVSPGDTDAAREELIGKTINLLSTESVAPTQIYAVIVAQSIRDVGGSQFRKDVNGNDVSMNCNFGTFDYNNASGIYFDEITGEVKMFVTIDRDINTGRMTVRRIDYLE